MKFKYSAYTNNTSEMRMWLKNIGYYQLASDYMFENEDKLLSTNGECGFFDTLDKQHSNSLRYINCLGNTSLFKAVTAIREDSDIYQQFTSGGIWLLCNTHSFSDYCWVYGWKKDNFHKASLKELQQHFKIEGK